MASVSHQQITRYGLLALAGLSTEAAQAGVVSSTSVGFVPFTIEAGQAQNVDFGNGVSSPFRFSATPYTYGGIQYGTYFAIQTGGAGSQRQLAALSVGFNNPVRFAANYQLGPGAAWVNVAPAENMNNDVAGYDQGAWNGSDGVEVSGFLGIRFQSSALDPGFHYGFFDVSYDNTPTRRDGALTIRGFAYETDADTAITTFAIGRAAAAPEPTSLTLVGLSLLACGGAGIRTLRAQTKVGTSSTTTTLDA